MDWPDFYVKNEDLMKPDMQGLSVIQIHPVRKINLKLDDKEFGFLYDENHTKLFKMSEDEIEFIYDQIAEGMVLDMNKKENSIKKKKKP